MLLFQGLMLSLLLLFRSVQVSGHARKQAAESGSVAGSHSQRALFTEWDGWNVKVRNDKDGTKKTQSKGVMSTIPHSSLVFPLLDPEDDDQELEWDYFGASYPNKYNAILVPAKHQRVGGIWAKNTFAATTFACSVVFSHFLGQDKSGQRADGGWGIFFHNANVSPVPNFNQSPALYVAKAGDRPYGDFLNEHGYGFLGHPDTWGGFGVVFRTHIDGVFKPGVSIVVNENNSTNYGGNRIQPDDKLTKWIDLGGYGDNVDGVIRLQLNGRTMRAVINVWPHKQGRSKDHAKTVANSWTEIGRAKVPVSNNWHVGLTSLTSTNKVGRPDGVKILGLRLMSDDKSANSQAFEDIEKAEHKMNQDEMKRAEKSPTGERKSHLTPEDEADMAAEESLTKSLHQEVTKLRDADAPIDSEGSIKLIKSCQNVLNSWQKRNVLSSKIISTEMDATLKRISKITDHVFKLKAEYKVIVGGQKMSSLGDLRSHITGLHETFTETNAKHDKHHREIHNTMHESRRRNAGKGGQATNLFNEVNSRVAASQNRLMMMMFVIVVMAIGAMGFVFKKLKAHEKHNYFD